MFCGNCGTEIKENSVYCPNCGQRISQIEMPKNKENKVKNWICVNKKKAIAVVSILAVFLIGVAIFSKSQKRRLIIRII